MAKEMDYIDISSIPDLLRIAEEVRITKKPHVLRRDNTEELLYSSMKELP